MGNDNNTDHERDKTNPDGSTTDGCLPVIAIIAAVALLILYFTGNVNASEIACCEHDVTLISYTDTTFTYRITSGHPGLSHVDLYLCASKVESVSWPHTEIKSNYIRLDNLNMEECDTKTVTVTTQTAFTPRDMRYTWKAARQSGDGMTEGPMCNSNAIKLLYFRAGK